MNGTREGRVLQRFHSHTHAHITLCFGVKGCWPPKQGLFSASLSVWLFLNQPKFEATTKAHPARKLLVTYPSVSRRVRTDKPTPPSPARSSRRGPGRGEGEETLASSGQSPRLGEVVHSGGPGDSRPRKPAARQGEGVCANADTGRQPRPGAASGSAADRSSSDTRLSVRGCPPRRDSQGRAGTPGVRAAGGQVSRPGFEEMPLRPPAGSKARDPGPTARRASCQDPPQLAPQLPSPTTYADISFIASCVSLQRRGLGL